MSLVELRAAAEAGNIPTADELVTRARALAPGLRERAVKAERDRNIARESVAEYLASGLIHTLCCGASGWCINFGAVTEAEWPKRKDTAGQLKLDCSRKSAFDHTQYGL